MFLVKESPRGQAVLSFQIPIEEFGISLDFYAKVPDELFRGVAVREGCGDPHGAAIAHKRLSVVRELVAFGVTANVVVIIENQHALVVSKRGSPEVGGRKP